MGMREFWGGGDGNGLKLDCGSKYMALRIYQNSWSSTLKMSEVNVTYTSIELQDSNTKMQCQEHCEKRSTYSQTRFTIAS